MSNDWHDEEKMLSVFDSIIDHYDKKMGTMPRDIFESHWEGFEEDIHHLRTELEQVKAERDRYIDMLMAHGEMNNPPCFVCGYNGSGYYQPNIHKCAEKHHKLTAGEGE